MTETIKIKQHSSKGLITGTKDIETSTEEGTEIVKIN